MMNEVTIIPTIREGVYIMVDSGINYIYDQKANTLKKTNSLTVEYLRKKGAYEVRGCEIDNWKAW